MFAVHNWPRWGNAEIVEVLEKQRDLYGYLHDQTLHLANQGVTIGQVHNRRACRPASTRNGTTAATTARSAITHGPC